MLGLFNYMNDNNYYYLFINIDYYDKNMIFAFYILFFSIYKYSKYKYTKKRIEKIYEMVIYHTIPYHTKSTLTILSSLY